MTDRINLGGITNTTLHLETDGTIHVTEYQDCQSILDRNQRGRDHRFDASSPTGFYRETHEIPMVVMWQWHLECGHRLGSAEFDEYMNKKLRDPEFKALLSAPTTRDPHVVIKGVR